MISLALPVYNGANYLREALESAVSQGPELVEIVVSDNCSADGTAQIIAEFVRRDPRVRHERSEVFLNQADNISRAVQLCRQEWVQLLCHDDLLRPGAIAALAGVIAGVEGKACALIGHQPAHLFTDEHTYRHRNGVGMVETRTELMAAPVSSRPDQVYFLADTTMGPALRHGGLPYLPSVTTAAVRKSAFMQRGGFDGRWVHFDIFFWARLVQDHGYVVVNDHWTLTRVHPQQVAVVSRKNQRSYRDFRDFYQTFGPEARGRYGLSRLAYWKLRLKPASQASAPLVVALFKREPGIFFAQLQALPVLLWPVVLILTVRNFFLERRRLGPLRKLVPDEIIFE